MSYFFSFLCGVIVTLILLRLLEWKRRQRHERLMRLKVSNGRIRSNSN